MLFADELYHAIIAAHHDPDPRTAARYRPFASEADWRPARPTGGQRPNLRSLAADALQTVSTTSGRWARRLRPVPVGAPCCQPGCC